MRILQLHARYRIRAGEDTVVDTEAAALERAGHDVHRLLIDNPTGAVPTVLALARSSYNRPVARQVRERIGAVRPDVVHVHNTWFAMSSSAVSAAAATTTPVVMTLHNFRLGCLRTDLFRDGAVCTACLGRAPLDGVRHGCYHDSRVLSAVQATEVMITRRRGVLDRAVTRFVAPSQFMADRLADIGVPTDRLVVKPHFVADPGARPAPPSASDDIVVVGRLAPGKGIDTLLEAWARTSASERRRLVVIGDGPLADSLGTRLPERVEMLGWQDRQEIVRRLLHARALVAPSELYETFGMVLIEAMSAGLPIVVSSVAGARDVVGVPDDLVFGPRDVRGLADAIDRLDDRRVDAVGAANRSRFERDYDVRVGVANLESLYADTIAAAQRDRT